MLLAGVHAPAETIRRLKAESEMIARLQRPGIVQIHDVGEHDGVPYLCLELIEGGSLADRLLGRAVAERDAARLVSILARTVQFAHEHGVIHRDLKPANVLVDHPIDTPTNEWERLLLTDFGLAKRLDGDPVALVTRTGDVVGTPAYMAPEQVMASKSSVGPAVDVYGLGAILYELLTGRPPFLGASPLETALRVITEPPEPPRFLITNLSPVLEAICLQCLEKDPARRLASPGQLAVDLESYLGESSRHVRSNRLIVRAASSFLVALGILVAILIAGRPRSVPDRQRVDDPVAASLVLPRDGERVPRGSSYEENGQLVYPGLTDSDRPYERSFHFDLCDLHRLPEGAELVESLKVNAKVLFEPKYGIRYWCPDNANEWSEVVYRFSFDFPIRFASLYASIWLPDLDSLGELLVSPDPTLGWSLVSAGETYHPYGGNTDVSDQVRGSHTIFVKARLKGRSDGESSFAQFLRSATDRARPELHAQHVFELRASPKVVPFVKLEARYGTDDRWLPLRFESEGGFRLIHPFPREGGYLVGVRAIVDGQTAVEESRRIWVTTPGCEVALQPVGGEISGGRAYQCAGRIAGGPCGIWTGTVDYGDQSAEQRLLIASDGSFFLEHVYPLPGDFRICVAAHDQQGHVAANATKYMVRE
jgi:serine/threonine protein kinase